MLNYSNLTDDGKVPPETFLQFVIKTLQILNSFIRILLEFFTATITQGYTLVTVGLTGFILYNSTVDNTNTWPL